MVAVVSMKTIMKKNSAITLTSSTPLRKKPFSADQAVREDAGRVAGGIGRRAEAPAAVQHRRGPARATEYQPGGTGPLHQLPQPIAKP